jgi:hypothetical protein
MPFIGNQPTQGRFIELDSLTASATDDYTLQLNGANFSPESVNNLLVSINGVIQGSSTMSLNGAVLTVGATLSSSDTIDFVRVFGNVGTVSTPTDGSVTANKIGTGAVTSAKIADGTIVNADINADAGIAGSKLGTDAVLQVKYTQYISRTSVSLSANTSTPLSVLTVNITPKSTSSIIKLDTHIFHEWGGAHDPQDTVSTPTDGSVTANKIGTGAITNVKVADNASISGSKLGTGAVLQVHTELTTAVLSNVTLAGQSSELTASSGTLWHTCASFTPKFSNSKLLFQTSVITAHETGNIASGHFAIVTDGSTLFARVASLVSYTSWGNSNNGAFIAFNHSFNSWGTSAKQLQIKFGCQHASGTAAQQYVNTVSSDGYVHSTSKSIGITIMEIGA